MSPRSQALLDVAEESKSTVACIVQGRDGFNETSCLAFRSSKRHVQSLVKCLRFRRDAAPNGNRGKELRHLLWNRDLHESAIHYGELFGFPARKMNDAGLQKYSQVRLHLLSYVRGLLSPTMKVLVPSRMILPTNTASSSMYFTFREVAFSSTA